MTRTRKMIALPDWQDSAAVRNFIVKVLNDCHQQTFPDKEQELFCLDILRIRTGVEYKTVFEMIHNDYTVEPFGMVETVYPQKNEG